MSRSKKNEWKAQNSEVVKDSDKQGLTESPSITHQMGFTDENGWKLAIATNN